jgi:hypothetical protein
MADLSFRQQIYLTIIDKLIIALLLVVAGLYANEYLELFKTRAQAAADREKAAEQLAHERTQAEIQMVQRQLSDLYYPLYFRLAKDDGVWDAIMRRGVGPSIEQSVILPNNKEVLALLETHADLIFRSDESREPALMNAFLQYERHMAVYLGLRATGDTRRPADLGVEYPNRICHLVEKRVQVLETKLSTLRGEPAAATGPPQSACAG